MELISNSLTDIEIDAYLTLKGSFNFKKAVLIITLEMMKGVKRTHFKITPKEFKDIVYYNGTIRSKVGYHDELIDIVQLCVHLNGEYYRFEITENPDDFNVDEYHDELRKYAEQYFEYLNKSERVMK